MMDIQYIIAGIIIVLAALFAGRSIFRRTLSFGNKPGCGADCGCGGKAKKLSS
jgi:hypothetical protein